MTNSQIYRKTKTFFRSTVGPETSKQTWESKSVFWSVIQKQKGFRVPM